MAKADSDARTWNLDHILPLESFEATYAKVEALIERRAQQFERLSPDMSVAQFQEIIQEWEEENRLHLRLYERPALEKTTNLDDQATQQRLERVKNLSIRIAQATQPINFWLKGLHVEGKQTLDDANAKRLFASVPDQEHQFWRARKLRIHSLTIPEEDLATEKNADLHSALLDVRTRIEKNQRYVFAPKGKASRVITTTDELMQYIQSPDAAEREAAYRAMLAQFAHNEELYFPIYCGIVNDWAHEASRRKHESPISMRNAENDVPDAAIETLMRVCADNVGIFQRYFRWKARKLGVARLSRYDIYAPLERAQGTTTLKDAITLVLDTFEHASKRFHDNAKRIIDAHHIDSHPHESKQSGAFCATIVPDLAPYVMLNWTGKPRDVSVLAHELGHGVHSLYAEHHSVHTQHASLPLCETASTFAESVLFERQLAEAPDDTTRAAMLSEKIGDAYASVIRQNYFVRFELLAHERIPNGITRDELGAEFLKLLREQFGDAVDVPDEFRHEWAFVPHIVHTPFYCYSYSFGELLSLALYARYKNDKSFFAHIERILESGGAEDPDVVLKRAGVDMRDPRFWQGSFDIIRGWVDQLEQYSKAA